MRYFDSSFGSKKVSNACQISKTVVWYEFQKRAESLGVQLINERSLSTETQRGKRLTVCICLTGILWRNWKMSNIEQI